MEKDEKIKLVYEQSSTLHRYFLNWRYSLIAGFIVIISAIGYFALTWVQKPENYSILIYILTCSCGIIITLVFALMNHRITRLIWNCQNKAYLNEKDLGFKQNGDFDFTKLGLYGNLLNEKIREKLDEGEENPEIGNIGIFNPLNHTGILNWFFIMVIIGFIILIFQTCDLNREKIEWDKKQKPITKAISHGGESGNLSICCSYQHCANMKMKTSEICDAS